MLLFFGLFRDLAIRMLWITEMPPPVVWPFIYLLFMLFMLFMVFMLCAFSSRPCHVSKLGKTTQNGQYESINKQWQKLFSNKKSTVQGIVFTWIFYRSKSIRIKNRKKASMKPAMPGVSKQKYLGVSLTEDTSNIDGIHAMMDSALRVPLVWTNPCLDMLITCAEANEWCFKIQCVKVCVFPSCSESRQALHMWRS